MNSTDDIKLQLKDIIREHLDKRVSEMFLAQTFVIIDQSAFNKESFAVAADRVSKRIALFIDTGLSQAVYNKLTAIIGTAASPQGIRRRFPRVDFAQTVLVNYEGKRHELISWNISEGGIFIKADNPFPINAKVEITLSLKPGHRAMIKGTVVNHKSSDRRTSLGITGMGIEFKEIDESTAKLLRKLF